VKNRYLCLLFLSLILHSPLCGGEDDFDDVDSELAAFHPFTLDSSCSIFSKNTFKNVGFEDEELLYGEADSSFEAVLPLNLCNGIVVRCGGRYTWLDWADNRHFQDKNFFDMTLFFGGYTLSFEDWLWRAGAEAILDSKHLDFDNYARFQGLIWGRYSCTPCLGFHIGIAAGSGCHEDFAYPIAGFDYQGHESWKIEIVFPLHAQITFSACDGLDIDVAARRIRRRHRLSEKEDLAYGIFEYRAYGVELGAAWDLASCLRLRFHGGSSGGSQLDVLDQRGEHVADYRLDGALYAGGSLTANF
jgi:hypothetical protein